ncbi:MAG: histidine phosphatase family protein [Candidatus Omnitrophica bacterium]|nr:histidine phosphatase family protein [Candidatus Omnitrophota bacterium]
MTRLILIRHGVTEWNKEKRYCGHKDIGLSDAGRSQVKSLSRRLNAVRFDKVYSSDRKRAMQTGRMLFKQTRIIPNRGLREINFGVLEGLRHKEIMERYADIYKKWLKNPLKNNIPKAEPMNIFKKRVKNSIRNIIRSNPDETIAIICHGGVIGIFVNGISKNKNFWRCVPSPASITIVEYDRGKPRLKKFNDTTHLR